MFLQDPLNSPVEGSSIDVRTLPAVSNPSGCLKYSKRKEQFCGARRRTRSCVGCLARKEIVAEMVVRIGNVICNLLAGLRKSRNVRPRYVLLHLPRCLKVKATSGARKCYRICENISPVGNLASRSGSSLVMREEPDNSKRPWFLLQFHLECNFKRAIYFVFEASSHKRE